MSPLVDKETLQREFPMTPEIEKMWEDYDKNKTVTDTPQYDDEEWTDYPYIGIGKKPCKSKHPTEEQLERIVGG